jgi:hypothetical protein
MYKEGFGFVVDDDEFARMAKLGIGMPVQQSVVQQPIQEQVTQEPVQQQVQEVYREPEVQLNDAEISASVDKYLKGVLGENYGASEVKQEYAIPEVKQNDDFFSSWMSQDKVVPETREEQKQVPVVQDSVLDYRKGIVEASIKMGKDPAMIERTIATITPEEYVVFAEAKARYEESLRQPVEQPKQQIVFNSLKPKPVASVVQASPAEFEQRTITQSNVIGNAIKNKFY